jgi:hypothetical protein
MSQTPLVIPPATDHRSRFFHTIWPALAKTRPTILNLYLMRYKVRFPYTEILVGAESLIMSLTQEQDETINIYEPEAIMTTYKDLKSVKYIESIINYAEGLRKFNFKRTGKNRYSAHCPFHVDNKDSFRVYVDGKDEVRFKCFGACQGGADDEKANWDIYDLIMVSNKCSFREAQIAFAKYMGVEKFTPY